MPRRGRVVLPNFPHHVVQRGHNKQVVFAEEVDFLYYLSTLEAQTSPRFISTFEADSSKISEEARLTAGDEGRAIWLRIRA